MDLSPAHRPLSLGYLKEGWVLQGKGRWARSPPSLSLSLPSGSLPTSFPTNFLVGLSGAFLGNPLYCKMNKKLKNNRRPLPRGMHPPPIQVPRAALQAAHGREPILPSPCFCHLPSCDPCGRRHQLVKEVAPKQCPPGLFPAPHSSLSHTHLPPFKAGGMATGGLVKPSSSRGQLPVVTHTPQGALIQSSGPRPIKALRPGWAPPGNSVTHTWELRQCWEREEQGGGRERPSRVMVRSISTDRQMHAAGHTTTCKPQAQQGRWEARRAAPALSTHHPLWAHRHSGRGSLRWAPGCK